MTIEFRRPRDEGELEGGFVVDSTAFHNPITDDYRARGRQFLELDRALLALEDDRVVGFSANVSLELTVPGGARLPLTGVTWVGVLPTHRRRGVLTGMMARLLEDGREHHEPMAGLYASESVIYRRYGYGPASRVALVQIDSDALRLRNQRPVTGAIELVELEQAVEHFGAIHERVRADNGALSRPDNVLRSDWFDQEDGNANPRRRVIHRDAAGTVDGLMSYRVDSPHSADWLPDGTVTITEMWCATEEARLELWRFAAGIDLTRHVRALGRPVDEPIVDLLADPRRWRTSPVDALHLCLQDIDAALAARRYSTAGTLTLEVIHPDGRRSRHHLEAGHDGAAAETTGTADPDLRLELAALGQIYLGDTALDRLHRAGVVDELTTGAVERASFMFAWPRRPWAGYVF